MSQRLDQLRDLEAQMHKVNQAFAAASRPLGGLSHMSLDERGIAAARIREVQARWEQLASQISELLHAPAETLGESTIAKDGPR